jgi:hypothetical protein
MTAGRVIPVSRAQKSDVLRVATHPEDRSQGEDQRGVTAELGDHGPTPGFRQLVGGAGCGDLRDFRLWP